MIDLVNDTKTIKMTVDSSGLVWCLDGFGRPKSTGRCWQEFVKSGLLYSGTSGFRIPGIRRNIGMALKLNDVLDQGGIRSLEVCSPWCCGPGADSARPDVLLYAARNFAVPASVGGWHNFNADDVSSFRIALAAIESRKLDRRDLLLHPVGKAATWISGVNAEALLALVGEVVDPRWFIDPAEPDKSNKLQQFLGLDPATQRAGDHKMRARRNRLVLSCWKTIEPPPVSNLRPSQFLWRTWHEKGGGWKGDLAASKRFISFLRQVWLMSLCRSVSASEIFVPSIFFQQTEEANDFTRHVTSPV